MLINAIQLSNLMPIKNTNRQNVSFTSAKDSYQKNNIKEFEFSSNVSKEAKKHLLKALKEIIEPNSTVPVLGYGATGLVYRVPNVEGFGIDGVVIKISHTDDKNPITGEKQKVDFSYDDEIKTLKKLTPLGENAQQYVGKMELQDGRHVLITTFVSGKEPDFFKNPLNKRNLKSALETLGKLDEIGVLHRDLKKENLIIDSDNNFKLIDFGEAVDFDIKDFKKNDSERNFISFEVPTNLQSFEDTFISPYFNELKSQDETTTRDFYKHYLSQKAHIIHEPKAQKLAQYLQQNSLTKEEENAIKDMIKYQETLASVLQNPNETIANIELMKNQVTYLSELAYKNEILLSNPLANVTLKTNALISAKKLEAMVQKELSKPNTTETRDYLKYQLQIAKYRQQKIAGWLNGLVGWLCTCLTTDINTDDANKKKLIDECVGNNFIEDFEIPKIATFEESENILNEG